MRFNIVTLNDKTLLKFTNKRLQSKNFIGELCFTAGLMLVIRKMDDKETH